MFDVKGKGLDRINNIII